MLASYGLCVCVCVCVHVPIYDHMKFVIGEGEDDDYSGDDEQDPRMPRRRGKYVRVC